MRILFIARYRDPSMVRKLNHMAQVEGITLRAVFPATWKDDLLHIEQRTASWEHLHAVMVPMIGPPSDPHRAFYRSLTFGTRAFRPDIIHAEEEPDSLAALQIATVRNWLAPRAKLLLHTWQNLARPLTAPVRWVQQQTLRAADAIFCANEEAIALLHRVGYTRPTPLIPAVGVDTDVFLPRAAPPPAPFTIGYVGRLVPEKGIDLLIDAVGLLRDRSTPVHLRIIGAGPNEQELRDQTGRLNLAQYISFTTAVPPAQLVAEMATLHTLVLPSRATPVWKEQLGRVLLEAMAVGVPVIGAHSGAIPEVIGEAGLLFAENDVVALAACIQRLLDSPALCADLSTRGLQRVRDHYSQRVLAARTLAFYHEIAP